MSSFSPDFLGWITFNYFTAGTCCKTGELLSSLAMASNSANGSTSFLGFLACYTGVERLFCYI